METPALGTFEFPDDFENKLNSAVDDMDAKHLDEMEIPNESGLILVRVESETYRQKKETLKTMAPFQSRNGSAFMVCYK
jgi:hypothetical protein